MNDFRASEITGTVGRRDGRSWLARQLDGVVWAPVAIALGVAVISLLLEAVSAVACGGGWSDCAVRDLNGVGGFAFVVVPGASVVSLVMTSYRPGWSTMRQRALVRIARGVAAAGALAGAAAAAIVGMLFACSGGFLCGDDPAAAAGLFTAAGAALGMAAWSATARGRWWLFILVGAAVGALPGAVL